MVVEIHGLLHKALDDAVKWGLVGHNVCDLVERPRLEEKEKPLLNKDQALALLESVKEHRLGVILLVDLTTGIRRGELLFARTSSCDVRRVSAHRTNLSFRGQVERDRESASDGWRGFLFLACDASPEAR